MRFFSPRRAAATLLLALPAVLLPLAVGGAAAATTATAPPSVTARVSAVAVSGTTAWVGQPRGTYHVDVSTGSYGPYGEANTYDVYRPAGEPSMRRPMVVVVPGTGWVRGGRASSARWAADLASRGYVAFGVSHRLASTPGGAWDAQYVDVQLAVAKIRRGAAAWGGDPTRIAVLGSSSGGSMALHSGRWGGVRAVAAWSPTIDFYRVAYTDRARFPSYADLLRYQLIRCGVTVCRPKWTSAQPLDPYAATLIVHSRYEAISYQPGEAMVQRLQAAGVPAKIVLLDTATHGGEVYMQTAWPTTVSFLRSAL